MSEVRGRSLEDPMPEGRWPRGVTPRPRSGAVAESTRLRQHRNGREELPHDQGQGGGPEEIPSVQGRGGGATRGLPRLRGQGRQPGGDTPRLKPEARGGGREELPHAPTPEARGGGWEDQPHAVATWAQEGLEELSHVEGQEGGGGEEIPLVQGKEHWLRFAGAAVKRYPRPR